MYKIMGMNADGIREEIDSTDDCNEVDYLVDNYKMAFGETWDIWYETK